MGLQARILPPDEWEKLSATPSGLAESWRNLSPVYSRVIVVEDPTGAIVATWAIFTAVHVEGLWIDPAHQGHGGAARALLGCAIPILQADHVEEVCTQAESPEVVALIEKVGGREIPGTAWVLPIPPAEEG